MNMFNNFMQQLKEAFFPTYPDFTAKPMPQTGIDPITMRVLVISHNPHLPNQGNKKLSEHFELWTDPQLLVANYINDLREASYGYVNYEVVEHIEVDGFPVKQDGFAYTPDSFMQAWHEKSFHDPDAVDYLQLVHEFQMIERINRDEIDEVWLMGMPYAGYWESTMAGPDAFWCNSSPLQGTEAARKRFVIMGFNYERGVGEMLESMGHRIESIMREVYRRHPAPVNYYEQFIRYDKKYPGQAECGNVHFAPNSLKDYDWGNPRAVESYCDDWLNFPNLTRQKRTVTCAEWGNGDIRLHHLWWMKHMPHVAGQIDGISNNWWTYIMNPDLV